jgi:hypothetical protein
MYHANAGVLGTGWLFPLAILAEAQRFLDALSKDHAYAQTLVAADGSRRIFNTNDKLRGPNSLSYEMDDLLIEVGKEHSATLASQTKPSLAECRQAIHAVTF